MQSTEDYEYEQLRTQPKRNKPIKQLQNEACQPLQDLICMNSPAEGASELGNMLSVVTATKSKSLMKDSFLFTICG